MAIQWTDYPERVETFDDLLSILETLERHDMEVGFTAPNFQKERGRRTAYKVHSTPAGWRLHPDLDQMLGLERLLDRFDIDGYSTLTQSQARELRRRAAKALPRNGAAVNAMTFTEIADALDATECEAKSAANRNPQPADPTPAMRDSSMSGGLALEQSPAVRLVAAIDELIEFVRPRYWEVLNPRRDIDENEWRELAQLEGRVVGLLAVVADGRIQFRSQPDVQATPESRMLYTSATGLRYFFCGQGRSIDRDDQWEPKMHALRAAVQTVIYEEGASRNTAQNQTLPPLNRLPAEEVVVASGRPVAPVADAPTATPPVRKVNTRPASVEPPRHYVDAAIRALPTALNNAPQPQGVRDPAERRGADYETLRQRLEGSSHNRDAVEWAIHRHVEAGRLEAVPGLIFVPYVIVRGLMRVRLAMSFTSARKSAGVKS